MLMCTYLFRICDASVVTIKSIGNVRSFSRFCPIFKDRIQEGCVGRDWKERSREGEKAGEEWGVESRVIKITSVDAE